ncbi:hypothetical protein DVB73_07075 [Pseudomonas plecoglossicida]|uniref:Uncharacterized protein n=1 Tax=Pseudomonas plecoglossicida TaxID=70775 RepID=A0AAD0VSY7_PSEDL|nr:hypothetical protein DVB73_07075 [Pseudomonas plecoglossicida]EPB94385.1 hypothetical protein L321_18607 [Pseudomonas plecoglossicida NB2011]QLB56326.1 hypothetical protein HAV28_16615 [Pseudomonas plecoglossicida]
MPQLYRFPSGELAPGLVLPPDIQRRLRLALASIEAANSPVNCLIARATAQGVCLGLDMGHVLARIDIERVKFLVDNVASQRLAELASDAQP